MKKILFSAVGSTDPIAGQHDGAILHIARTYDLDDIYLYYSKEMYELEQKDNRYVYCLNQLKERTGKTFNVHKIIKQDLAEVHIFDYFLTEFRNQIDSIISEEECELYLNVSSGTPAMKSALQVLGTIYSKPITTIQVVTPSKKYNEHREDVKGEYEVELQWELDMDNQEDYVNRCSISTNVNLAAELKKEIIKKQIHNYEYLAASSISEEIDAFLNPEVKKLLYAAEFRLKLDRVTCKKWLKDTNYKMFPHESGNEIDCFEYLLMLRIKMLKEQHIDFIRGITPLFVTLLEKIVERETSIKPDEYYIQQKGINGTMSARWDAQKIQSNPLLYSILSMDGKKELRNGYALSSHFVDILEMCSHNTELKQLVSSIRQVEEKIRNPLAHCITYMTEEVIRNETGHSTQNIFDMLRKLMIFAGIKVTDEDLRSYELCNQHIERML